VRWAEQPTPGQAIATLTLARQAVERRPDLPAPRLALGRALAAVGRKSEAARSLKEAAALFPEDELLAAALVGALAAVGEVDAALAEAQRWKGRPWASRRALRLLTEHSRFEEAKAFEDAVAALDPSDIDLLECRARRLRQEPQRLLLLADGVLARQPSSSHALYYRAIALSQLGRGDEAALTMAMDRFAKTTRVDVPAEYESDQAFRAAVQSEILANPTLCSDPAGYTTQNGLRTGSFPLPHDRACHLLLHAIQSAIGRYAAALAGDHAFVRSRPELARMTTWAIVLTGTGHQRLHHHPRPWLTGVYYVSGPHGTGSGGALRLGVLPGWSGVEPPWPVREVPPLGGTLVLFPSFIPHETVPTLSAEKRVSVAFDVHRVAAGSGPAPS
jgi:tetratricopeptide (TPR) repeat protein